MSDSQRIYIFFPILGNLCSTIGSGRYRMSWFGCTSIYLDYLRFARTTRVIVIHVEGELIGIFFYNTYSIFGVSQFHLVTCIVFKRNCSIPYSGKSVINHPTIFYTSCIKFSRILLREPTVEFSNFSIYIAPSSFKS